jgi:sulfide:quinone oxidoreductase
MNAKSVDGVGASFRVVIAGGGVAALEALLALRRLAGDRVSIELLSAEPQFWYRPLAVAEPFGLGEVHGLDLGVIADECGARLILDSLSSVDADAHVARTSAGGELEYDALLIAVGARPVAALPGAFNFRGPADTDAFQKLLSEVAAGERIVFTVPGSVDWPLPLYELALQTALHYERRGPDVGIALVTNEQEPLELFGPGAGAAIAHLLAEREIELLTGAYPVAFEDGVLTLSPEGRVEADRVVALPRLEGPLIAGVPMDAQGFIPTDPSGYVRELADVFAAGDATAFPIKQGGLAAQQADAAAEEIAALAGAEVEPEPFRPVLRGLILTGGAPLYARADLTGAGNPFLSGSEPLWWPPGKVVGRYVGPFLAERSETILTPAPYERLSVDADLSSLAAAE